MIARKKSEVRKPGVASVHQKSSEYILSMNLDCVIVCGQVRAILKTDNRKLAERGMVRTREVGCAVGRIVE